MDRRAFLTWAAALAVSRRARAQSETDDEGAALYALEPCAPDYARQAPHVVVTEAWLPAPPARVFATLIDPAPWPRWLPLVDRIVNAPGPRGVGCERDAHSSLGTIREHFIVWDVDERLTFYARAATSTTMRRFFEDWWLRPAQGGRTHLTWTVALAPAWWAAPLAPIAAATFAAVGPRALRDLGALVA